MGKTDKSFNLRFDTAQDIIDAFTPQLEELKSELQDSDLHNRRRYIWRDCLHMPDEFRSQYCDYVRDLRIFEKDLGDCFATYISFDVSIKLLDRAIRFMNPGTDPMDHIRHAIQSLLLHDVYMEVSSIYMSEAKKYLINKAPSVHFIVRYTRENFTYLLGQLEDEKREQQLVD
ncbi:hypothetical protein KKF03_05345 [Patescibacteria group bacterium]|nr:hypothetical protein [Patescibacteria group bacterium]MBU1911081.1 hypothetical protein [Patescibacteria group bacterium]